LLYLAETYTVGGKPEDMKKSEQLLLLARGKDPNNAEVYVTLGNLYFAKKPPVYDLSMDNYNKAVQLRPDFAEGFFRIGLMQKSQQKYSEAVDAFKKAISLDAKYAPAYRELSEVYNLYGKYDDAITNMKKYLDFAPGDKRGQYLYAKALFSAQKYQEALNVIQKIDTVTPVLKRLEGYILTDFGKYAEAKKAMDQFFGLNHPLMIANDYQVYGKILLKLGDVDQAAKNFEKAVAMDNSLAAEVYTQFAELYKDKGDKLFDAKDTTAAAAQYDKAIENYMRLASLNAQDYKSLVAVAQLQTKVNRLEDAYKTYQKLVSQFNNWVYAHKMLARAAFQLDPDYKKGLVVEPYSNVLQYGLEDKATNKASLIEAASALSYYYINVAEDFAKARQMVELLLELDTANAADHQETLQFLNGKG
jgi:tetratricopeptide (TPR) repeat protein